MGGDSEAQNEGSLMAARELILRQATRRFGEWSEAADRLAAISKLDELEELARRVITARDWLSLLTS